MARKRSGRIKRKRIALWQRDPNCHWCGQYTILPEHVRGADKRKMATIDHLWTRLDPERTIPCRGERRLVLACAECNNHRGRDRERRLPLMELWARSQRHSTECHG